MQNFIQKIWTEGDLSVFQVLWWGCWRGSLEEDRMDWNGTGWVPTI